MTIESKTDFKEALRTLGWTLWSDGAGETIAGIRIPQDNILLGPDTILSGIVGWHDDRQNPYKPEEERILSCGLSCSLTTDAVSAAYTLLLHSGKRVADECIILQGRGNGRAKQILDLADVKIITDELIIWAKCSDIEHGVFDLIQLPTNSIGALPARHLAALAAQGAVERLSDYRDSFARGDRLGFVPYITDEVIANALDFAEKRAADRNWLPKTPRMRV